MIEINNKNVFYTLLLMSMFYLAGYMRYVIYNASNKQTKKLDKVTDFKQCPQMAEYLNDFQAKYSTTPYGIAAGVICVIIGTLCIAGIMLAKEKPLIEDHIMFFILLFFAMGYINSQKFTTCVVARVCGDNSCASKYFE